MANFLSREEQLSVLHLLVEGASLRSVTRLTGVHRTTIAKLMVRVGQQCREFLDNRMQNLLLHHVQCDEIWTFVKKKQGRLRPEEANNTTIGDQYLFGALDEDTKLIPCFALGKRNGETTARFINDLARRIIHREVFQIGHHPQISTDGWASYPTCIEDAFGTGARCRNRFLAWVIIALSVLTGLMLFVNQLLQLLKNIGMWKGE